MTVGQCEGLHFLTVEFHLKVVQMNGLYFEEFKLFQTLNVGQIRLNNLNFFSTEMTNVT